MDFMYQNISLIKQLICEQDNKCTEDKQTKSRRKSRETSEERKIRREKDRLRVTAVRANETIEQRNARLAVERERKRTMRARENTESKEIRKAKNRMRQAINRANETFAEAKARKINDRIRHMERRSRETLEEREIRLAKDRARHRKYRHKTIKKQFNSEMNQNFCTAVPSDVNDQVQWLRLRESWVNLKHSPRSTDNLDKGEIQIKEETVNINEDSVFGFATQETKTHIKIEPDSDIIPYSDLIHKKIKKEPNISGSNIPIIKKEQH